MITLHNMAVNQIPLLKQVDIKELDDGRIQVRRTKVQPSKLLELAKRKMMLAIECTCKAQNLTLQEEATAKLGTMDFKTLVTMDYVAMGGGREISPHKDAVNYERRASEYLTEALAILKYITGEEIFQNEFSNYLLK